MFDVAIVGAGILGLAHAYHFARTGKKVVVFERTARAEGASVRNFGMLWPIGQPAGARFDLALRSREHWLSVLTEAQLWHEKTGSLHLAYADDEARVLQELVAREEFPVVWQEPAAVTAHGIRRTGLKGALWSESEVSVDPREVLAQLPRFLQERYGVTFHFETTVFGYSHPLIGTSQGPFEADQLLICSGHDMTTLYPEVLSTEGMRVCKLQMMRTAPQPNGWRIGPMLAAGLTLLHYEAFRTCPSLPELQARLNTELPDYHRFGIHVLVSQNGLGELTLGDSHEYGDAISPFDKTQIDTLVLEYLARFLEAPRLEIASRWQGFYLKHPHQPWFIATPDEGVTVVTGVGGAGMTLSFGLAERVVEKLR